MNMPRAEKKLKTYKNRFASIEQLREGGWLVWNEVTGLTVSVNPLADFPVAKVFPNYQLARFEMVRLYQYYQTI